VKLPNILSLARLVLAPLFFVFFLSDQHGGFGETPAGPWVALGLALFYEASDVADGYLARSRSEISQLGKILDPLADRISRFTVFLAFLAEGYAPAWAVMAIFFRETIVSSLRILAASQGQIVAARTWGKVKAIVQGGAIVLILTAHCAREPLGWVVGPGEIDPLKETLAMPVMWFVAAVTLASMIDYLVALKPVLQKLDR